MAYSHLGCISNPSIYLFIVNYVGVAEHLMIENFSQNVIFFLNANVPQIN